MYNVIALISTLVLMFLSYEKNFLKYGIIIGIEWAILQMLTLGEVTYVGFLPSIVMLIGYSLIATVLGYLLRNMQTRINYVILYTLFYDILAYVFYRFVILFIVLILN